jgi:Tfp pilus assembly protein PilO
MKKSLHILIVLALLNMVGGGLLWYGYTSIQEIKDKETDLRSQLQEENQKGQKIAALRQTLSSAAKDKEQLEHYLVDSNDENQIQLIARIERLGTTTGAQIVTNSFDLQPLKPPAIHGEYSVTGSWGQLYHFLRLMEEFPSRVTISRYDIRLTPANPTIKNSQDIWSGTMSVDFASLKQNPS